MAVRMKDIARDLGVSVAGRQSVLALSRYSTSQIPTFYQPAFAPGNVRSALNPLTGAYLPAAYIGLFVPGTGNPANGGVLSGDSTYPRGFVNQAPRHRHAGLGRVLYHGRYRRNGWWRWPAHQCDRQRQLRRAHLLPVVQHGGLRPARHV